MYKLGFKEAEEPESKLPTLIGSKNIYYCFTDYAKAFECVDHSTLWKILKETVFSHCYKSLLYFFF